MRIRLVLFSLAIALATGVNAADVDMLRFGDLSQETNAAEISQTAMSQADQNVKSLSAPSLIAEAPSRWRSSSVDPIFFPSARVRGHEGNIQRPLTASTPVGCGPRPYRPAPWLKWDAEIRRARHFSRIQFAACEAGLPPDLLDAVVAQESAYRTDATSAVGAKGLMQIMPGTAATLGLSRVHDPLANLRAGARYLRKQIDRFGRADLALAAYNAGPERRSLAEGRIPSISETRTYVRTIFANWARLASRNTDARMMEAPQQTAPELSQKPLRRVEIDAF